MYVFSPPSTHARRNSRKIENIALHEQTRSSAVITCKCCWHYSSIVSTSKLVAVSGHQCQYSKTTTDSVLLLALLKMCTAHVFLMVLVCWPVRNTTNLSGLLSAAVSLAPTTQGGARYERGVNYLQRGPMTRGWGQRERKREREQKIVLRKRRTGSHRAALPSESHVFLFAERERGKSAPLITPAPFSLALMHTEQYLIIYGSRVHAESATETYKYRNPTRILKC